MLVGFWGENVVGAQDPNYDNYLNGQGTTSTPSSPSPTSTAPPTQSPTPIPPSNPVGTFDYIIVSRTAIPKSSFVDKFIGRFRRRWTRYGGPT